MGVRREGEHDRFEMRGELGIGASGSVYRVFDRQRGREIALKTLRRIHGADLYRFKREFRSLVDIAHPNLATLYELFAVGEEWMYTMELVDGVSFDRWVRDEPVRAAIEDVSDATVQIPRTTGESGALDEVRLRGALRQLADGVYALHAAGKVHRDLKPSNVLVDKQSGRVVILDFGLVVERDVVDRTHESGSVGTVAYMSPEQSADLPVGPPTDWYAIGVMLYEALTGRRPIRGAAHDVIARKRTEDPPRPSELVAGTPADLDELCMRLLCRDPEARPDGAAVLAALGAEPSSATHHILEAAVRPPAPADPAAMAWVREAYAASRDQIVVAMIHGPHGSGKTRVMEAFVDELRDDADALVIGGTDNSRVQTMLPGLDQALDKLSAYVMTLSRPEIEALMNDAAPLARMFPALRRIPVLQLPTLPSSKPPSPEDIIHHGLGALRRVFRRIGERRRLVLAVDESRGWDDREARLMTAHFQGPDMPRMLVFLAMDPDTFDNNPAIDDFRRWARDTGGDLRFFELRLSAGSGD
jgi:tRNA A-37 threonylcarbamoyl transferase component Bud32